MTTPRYLPVATFKQWFKTEKQFEDALLLEAINAAEMAIDNALGRRMQVAGEVFSSRVFRPNTAQSEMLFIDDAVEVESITDNTTELTTTGYQLEPLNGLSDSGEPWPYEQIRRISSWWSSNAYQATVTISARWGWPAIPPQVIESCKIIAADMLHNRDVRLGIQAVTDAGGVGTRENRTVREMVDRYASIRRVAIA